MNEDIQCHEGGYVCLFGGIHQKCTFLERRRLRILKKVCNWVYMALYFVSQRISQHLVYVPLSPTPYPPPPPPLISTHPNNPHTSPSQIMYEQRPTAVKGVCMQHAKKIAITVTCVFLALSNLPIPFLFTRYKGEASRASLSSGPCVKSHRTEREEVGGLNVQSFLYAIKSICFDSLYKKEQQLATEKNLNRSNV